MTKASPEVMVVMNTIEIDAELDFFFPEEEIHEILVYLLRFLIPQRNAFLTLRIVSDPEIQILNREFRGKDRPTDVLSFPGIDPGLPFLDLGVIVISLDTLFKQAIAIGHSPNEEFFRLLVHGVLHLLGYDHEISSEEELRMQKKEDECLEILKIFLDSNA